MDKSYKPLASMPLHKDAGFHQPHQSLPDKVTLKSPAIDVMTDFMRTTAYTIAETATLEEANQRMIRRGVRLLLVFDNHYNVCGLITGTDLLGEKPMQHIQKVGGKWGDILVRDVMTHHHKLEALDMAEVATAKVGNIVATLKKSGRQHALVVDVVGPEKSHILRGIFSSSQISKQLGMPINTIEIAQTFADIKQTLAG